MNRNGSMHAKVHESKIEKKQTFRYLMHNSSIRSNGKPLLGITVEHK